MTTYFTVNGPATITGAGGGDVLHHSHTVDGGVTLTLDGGDFANGYDGFVDGVNPSNVEFHNISAFAFVDSGNGADHIFVGDGDDTLNGGQADDILDGGRGDDVIIGGSGADVWGADKSYATTAVVVDLNAAAPQAVLGGSVTETEAFDVTTGSGKDRLTGTVTALNDFIDTGAGNDRIALYMAANDQVHGGSGRDALIVTSIYGAGATLNVNSGDLAGGYSGIFDGSDPHNINFTGIEDFGFTDTAGQFDSITAGDGKDTLSGGGGDDYLNSGGGVDVVDGGDGVDLWVADKSFTTFALKINLAKPGAQEYLTTGSVVNVEGMQLKSGLGDDKLQGMSSAWGDSVDAGGGGDVIGLSMNSTDTVHGGAGEDELNVVQTNAGGVSLSVTGDLANGYSGTFDGSNPHNVVFTGIENFSYTDEAGFFDDIATGDGKDTLNGGGGGDSLRAGGGRDVLRGGDGADTLIGGGGKDYLFGGSNGDRYRYSAVTDSAVGAQRDVIDDVGNGDLIDLSAIDADSVTGGDQAFTFIGTQGFGNVAGELRAVLSSGVTLISGDVDGDGAADFQIEVASGATVDAADFVP